ncbi:MAG: NAD(P)H-dependent glycerol-3-phosphate dehydrogenase [Pseudomonadota bacterium]
MAQQVATVGIVGGGAWGTALAQTQAAAGRDVTLWAFEPETVRAINEHRENRVFLPNVALHPRIRATGTLADVARADAILLVPPAQRLGALAGELAPHLSASTPLIICAKGIERAQGRLLDEVLAQAVPGAMIAALSGPSFAADVARGLPAALSIACDDRERGEALAHGLAAPTFRLYWSDDVRGVLLGGAIKNVLAIAAGIADGRQMGASAQAALTTRGFAELRRFAESAGAKATTMMGLSGLGDLLLTCGSPQSRNMSLGRALGEGRSLAEIQASRSSVAEGVFTAQALVEVAQARGVEMPIATAVHRVLEGEADVASAIAELLARPMRAEAE